MLTRLAEIGMDIAEAAGAAARASLAGEGPANDRIDPGLTYSRAARAVRMTIALQSRLLADLAALDRGEALAREAKVQARRSRIHHIVSKAIEAEHRDVRDIVVLNHETQERLRDEDDYGDLLELPLGEAVARICRELGLSPDWGDLGVAFGAMPDPSSPGEAKRRPEEPAAPPCPPPDFSGAVAAAGTPGLRSFGPAPEDDGHLGSIGGSNGASGLWPSRPSPG